VLKKGLFRLSQESFVGGLVLAFVGLFCGVVGVALATKGNLWWSPQLRSKDACCLAVMLFAPIVAFLSYRQNYSSPRYMNDSAPALRWNLLWWAISGLLLFAAYLFSDRLEYPALISVILISSPFFVYCWYAHRLHRASTTASSIAVGRLQSFENTIFIPAFLLCTVSFSSGLAWASLIAGTNGEHSLTALVWTHLSYGVPALALIFLYYAMNVSSIRLYIAFPVGGMTFATVCFVVFQGVWAKYIIVSFALTLMLGVAEVAKHLYLVETSTLPVQEKLARTRFFNRGANWSTIVFPLVCLWVPTVFTEMAFGPVVILAYVLILFWLLIEPNRRPTEMGFVFCLLAGLSTPAAFILSASGVGLNQSTAISEHVAKGGASEAPILLALIAILGFATGLLRFAKDLFGLKLEAITRNLWNPALYDTTAGCLFLLLLLCIGHTAALTVCWFALVMSPGEIASTVIDRSRMASRLPTASFAFALIATLALFAVYFLRKKSQRVLTEVEAINNMMPDSLESPRDDGSPPTQLRAAVQASTNDTAKASTDSGTVVSATRYAVDQIWWVVVSGRLGVSWIAGLAAAVVVAKADGWRGEGPIAAFVALTLVTMSGFILNDIYDVKKDLAAGKLRPITVGKVSCFTARFAALVFASFALWVSFAFLGGVPTLWLAVIICALCAYSPVSQLAPLTKGIFTAALSISPFLFAFSVGGAELPSAILATLFAYIVFRECVLDAFDIDGDRVVGVVTLASMLGRRYALIVGWLGMFGAVAVAVAVFDSSFSRAVMACGGAIQAIALYVAFRGNEDGVNLTRFTLLCGVAATALDA
jgi:4-hydroxybenzoate polyprenyltransferase